MNKLWFHCAVIFSSFVSLIDGADADARIKELHNLHLSIATLVRGFLTKNCLRKLTTAVTKPVTCLPFIEIGTIQKPFIQHEWRRMIHLSAFDFDILSTSPSGTKSLWKDFSNSPWTANRLLVLASNWNKTCGSWKVIKNVKKWEILISCENWNEEKMLEAFMC